MPSIGGGSVSGRLSSDRKPCLVPASTFRTLRKQDFIVQFPEASIVVWLYRYMWRIVSSCSKSLLAP